MSREIYNIDYFVTMKNSQICFLDQCKQYVNSSFGCEIGGGVEHNGQFYQGILYSRI